jgi:ATP-binding cassette subfamily C (CFTR/MRP) protein 1
VGKVGSGKSSLVSALTGNIQLVGAETVQVGKSIAIVEQEPWIQNMTLKKNILFGNEYNEERYKNVIQVCELADVLAVLKSGDSTEIGEKGINLSGGQKARVAIARAVYQNSDILILDDPLSALDVHVGRRIFKNCLKSFCNGKTIILVTQGQ